MRQDTVRAWHRIDSETQEALLDWYNVSEPDARDKRRLARLYFAHQFHFYDCAHCGARVQTGQPDNWDDFQGVMEREGVGQLCAECYSTYLDLKELAEE